tara:strand:- start:154952 stop:155389 length:438 start_codon:yes stop_codon:yes gene_type:complete
MTDFTPVSALIGGGLIGLSAVLVMLFYGRIAGISGLLGRLLPPWVETSGNGWRAAFIVGIIISPFIYRAVTGEQIDHVVSSDKLVMIAAGLFVGFGTGLGSGCTSGHGVCGISRLSIRSVIATATFIAFGILTVFVIRHLLGGAS